MNIQSEIERFIIDELLSGSRESLGPEEPLFSSGMVDSLGTLRLITFLEERFGVTVGDGEVGDENFKTISRIQALVERKQKENPAP
jgi:acyl carrier protein